MRLVGGITGAAASLIVDVTTGLPTAPFTLLLDPGAATEEVIEVTGVGGTTLTVTRGVDGTSAQSHSNGAEIRHAYSARDFQDSRNHEANTTTAHGVTGAVVGTTNTQTLTNKTLTNATFMGPTVALGAFTAGDISGLAGTFSGDVNAPNLATTAGTQTLTNKTMSGASNTFTLIPSAAVVGVDADIAGLATHVAGTAAHGATGAVVGTTNVQTLSGKTLTAPTLTGVATAATLNATTVNAGGCPVPHVESGAVAHAYAGGVGPVSTDIVFAHAYATVPAVTLGANSFSIQIEYGNLTITGFTLYSKGFNNVAPGTGTYYTSWIASGA